MGVWNLKSRVKQKAIDYQVSWQMISCSTDSKFLYMSCEDGVVVQFNTQEMKEEARFPIRNVMAQCGTNKDETLLFTANKSGDLHIFDLVTKQEVSRTEFG